MEAVRWCANVLCSTTNSQPSRLYCRLSVITPMLGSSKLSPSSTIVRS